ncbi:hypothetical protein KKF38_00120 [Patescibacteria group bacterium]|nr:hypothetical protein [Patescibacteria group bacterium]
MPNQPQNPNQDSGQNQEQLPKKEPFSLMTVKTLLVVLIFTALGTIIIGGGYLIMSMSKTDNSIISPAGKTQCKINSDCGLVYVGQDVCPPCDTLSEKYQCLNASETKKIRDKWNKFDPVLCTPCPTEFINNRYVCECKNGKCEKVKEELVEEVIITTDKAEYQTGEEVKLTIENNLQENIFGTLEVEIYKKNEWNLLVGDINYDCEVYRFVSQAPLIIEAYKTKEYEWNQKTGLCDDLLLDTKLRFKTELFNNPSDMRERIYYSNEFTIGEIQEVSLTTDKIEYQTGETIEVTIRNNFDFPIYYESPCAGFLNIFRYDGNGWMYVNDFSLDICFLNIQKLKPGQDKTFQLTSNMYDFPDRDQRYKALMRYSLSSISSDKISWEQVKDQMIEVYSNEFTIKSDLVGTGGSDKCNEMEKEINNMIEEIKYCESDDDCILDKPALWGSDCITGCYLIRSNLFNDGEYLSLIQEKVNQYQDKCEYCQLECPVPPEQKDIKCQNNKCVDARFAKTTLNEILGKETLGVDDWDWDSGQDCYGFTKAEDCQVIEWPADCGCRKAGIENCYECIAEKDKDATICENIVLDNQIEEDFWKDNCYWRVVIALNKVGMNNKINFCDKFSGEYRESYKEECLKLAE